MNRYSNLHRIQQLDPQRDRIEICHLIASYEFPWDVTRALELRANFLRQFPARTKPEFFTDIPSRSYPKGYALTDLGPPHILETLERPFEGDRNHQA